jgi:hypothetical protein
MTATPRDLDALSDRLWQRGLGGFCATTLSATKEDLHPAIEKLGNWIRRGKFPGAWPLGLHLEGPFLSPSAAGAHPPGAIRPLRFEELERLWELSQGTLKILTIAPETLAPTMLPRLAAWARDRGVALSLGHSQATEEQAHAAFQAGFRGVTHAWNAMRFHHRSPGPLGAALGLPGVYVELIVDGIHVAPSIARWVMRLHPRTCLVSDCAPAAATDSGTAGKANVPPGSATEGIVPPKSYRAGSHAGYPFGPLRTWLKDGACRLADGSLAGGGLLLPEAYARWLTREAALPSPSPLLGPSAVKAGLEHPALEALWKKTVGFLTTEPLRALQLPADLEKRYRASRRMIWSRDSRGLVSAAPQE